MSTTEIKPLLKSISYLGKMLPLFLNETPGDKNQAILETDKVIVTLKPGVAVDQVLESVVEAFLAKQCKQLITSRVTHYQTHFKLKPKKITIEKSFNKWGSCNSQKELTFNFLLITKPLEAIDYVVVHEMCHLMHMNHDRSFWRLLGSILPGYKETEKLLTQSFEL